jgi:hypothetical protein
MDTDVYTQFTSKKNLIVLINSICNELGMDTTNKQNIKDIIVFLKKLDGVSISKKYNTLEESNAFIIGLYKDHITQTKSLADNLDEIHSYLSKVIKTPGNDPAVKGAAYKDTFEDKSIIQSFVTSFNNADEKDKIELVKFINYESIWRSTYIIIDSRYQNIVNTDRSKISFNLQTTSKVRADHGGIVVGNTIRDIVEVEIYPFTIPYKPLFANFYKRITMTIDEWTSNSFEAYEDGAFHFVFDISNTNENLIYLKPVNSTFRFIKPVNYIDNFTLSFGAMLPKIEFDVDRMYTSSIDFMSTDGMFTFSEPHNLITGDLVYITGFSSPDVAKDVVLLEQVNRSSGHTIVKKNNYSISLNIDLSSMRREEPVGSSIFPIDTFQQNVLVYFASKRIQIPMKISYLLSPRLEVTTS